MIDQGVVSAGTFLVSILLARQFTAADYGAYALVLGGMFTLQLFNATLLVHPLSVLLVLSAGEARASLLKTALLLMVGSSVALGAVLGAVLILLGATDLVLPAFACFLLAQLQEGTRRGLVAEFRHREAVLGDAVSYLGQVPVLLGLLAGGMLTLPNALYGIAATSALAALLQAAQLRLRLATPLALRRTVAEFWAVGGFWALGNGLLSGLRLQLLAWALAASAGPAAAARFQAALNIVNLSNPLVNGLCNLIPQTAAQASTGGVARAWQAARPYLLIAAPPLLGYAALLLLVPGGALALVYGADSPYLELSLELRLLVVAALAGYSTDLIIAFLHGVRAVPQAFAVNALGAAVSAALVLGLAGPFGVVGAGLALIGANLARAAAVHIVLNRLTARRRSIPRGYSLQLGEIE